MEGGRRETMTFAPQEYDFGEESNYAFATTVTCANDEARKMFVEAYGHYLNYNHEQAIACFAASVSYTHLTLPTNLSV